MRPTRPLKGVIKWAQSQPSLPQIIVLILRGGEGGDREGVVAFGPAARNDPRQVQTVA